MPFSPTWFIESYIVSWEFWHVGKTHFDLIGTVLHILDGHECKKKKYR